MMLVSDRTRVGVRDRHRLHDHPAHRHPDDVRRLEPEVVEQPEGVVGQVAEARTAPAPGCRRRPAPASRGRPGASSIGRAPGVAVVVADRRRTRRGPGPRTARGPTRSSVRRAPSPAAAGRRRGRRRSGSRARCRDRPGANSSSETATACRRGGGYVVNREALDQSTIRGPVPGGRRRAYRTGTDRPKAGSVGSDVTWVTCVPTPWPTSCCRRASSAPRPAAVLREGSAVVEIGRYALRAAGDRRLRRETPYAARAGTRLGDPVLLVPGFLAGDGTLALMARVAARPGLPDLPLPHPRQRRLHAQRRRPARGAAGVDRDPARLAGADRRAQPRRHARPRRRRTPSRPGLQHRHPGQPDAGARRPPPLADARASRCWSGSAGPGVPGLMAEDCVAGVVRAAELRGVPRADAGRRRLHRDLLPARRHRRLAGLRRPGRAPGRGHRLPPRDGVRPAGHRRGRRRLLPDRRAPQLSKSIEAKARSFCSWCSELILRIVPLRERITSDSVVQPPA